MPNVNEREEVGVILVYSMSPLKVFPRQILRVVSQKVTASPSIDWREIASVTDGFSGADLQALVYNAHLEAVHASISDKTREDHGSSQSRVSEQGVRYVFLNSQDAKSVVSKAEETAVVHRVSLWLSSGL